MSFHAMNQALCRHLQLPLPDDGALVIRFDDAVDVIVDTALDGERVALVCCLCGPGALDETRALRLLQANGRGDGTDGAQVQVDGAGQAWLRLRLQAAGLGLDAYVERVMRFAGVAIGWRRWLAEGDAPAPALPLAVMPDFA